jgi:hypothetical protein
MVRDPTEQVSPYHYLRKETDLVFEVVFSIIRITTTAEVQKASDFEEPVRSVRSIETPDMLM